jgi:predicted AAA+ superfamily ATPase
MRDDELRRLLTDANPWWRAAAAGSDPTAWASSHRLLRDRAGHDLGYRADVLVDIATGPLSDLLVVLAGPRRIGKSVALLDAAATLCGRGDIDPRQIVHIPCDGMRDRDLRRVLTLGRELTRSVDVPQPRRRVWMLDEITGTPGWTTILKSARDGTSFGDDTVIVSGSRWAAGEDIEGSLLTGRAGTTGARRVRQLLPMTFRDYLAAARPQLARPPCMHPADLQATSVRQGLDALAFDVDDYDLAWQAYLTCGGFPRAVAEYTRTGAVSLPYLRDLAAWLRSDVDAEASPESLPALLSGLTQRAASPLNVRAAASALGYPSRQTFVRRLARLTGTFATLTCPHRDDVGSVVPGSQAKVYLVDPLLAWLPSKLRAGLPEPEMTTLTEMALGVALARAVDRLDEGRWVAGDTIGYTRTASGNEVDLAPVPVPSTAGPVRSVPLESKWVDAGWRSEAKVVEAKYAGGILATKSVLDLDHPAWGGPAPLVALLLA